MDWLKEFNEWYKKPGRRSLKLAGDLRKYKTEIPKKDREFMIKYIRMEYTYATDLYSTAWLQTARELEVDGLIFHVR